MAADVKPLLRDEERTLVDVDNREITIPTSTKEISFLELCSYYRHFVKGFATIAGPLHQACQKNKIFHWTNDCTEAFQKLKDALVSPPILTYPVPGQSFI